MPQFVQLTLDESLKGTSAILWVAGLGDLMSRPVIMVTSSRVAKAHMPLWQDLNIADALSLSLSPLDKDENLLKTIGYFWSDALNCFLFGHGPMTPTLLDVVMITGLDINSPNPAAHKMAEVPFKLSSKTNCTNWGTYMNQHMKKRSSD